MKIENIDELKKISNDIRIASKTNRSPYLTNIQNHYPPFYITC